jgi:hypothetical protein
MKKMKQLPSAHVHHLMLVFVDAITERAVVILEINGSLRVGMLHWAQGPRRLEPGMWRFRIDGVHRPGDFLCNLATEMVLAIAPNSPLSAR